MKILEADFILTCNENFDIVSNGAVCFDDKIIEIGSGQELRAKYKNATFMKLPKNSIILPGLINPHVHLEFSSNKTLLEYGGFVSWLHSVIKHREDIMAMSDTLTITNAINSMLQSGTTTIGAISSYGNDLEACINSPMKVVFFNEILGSNPQSVDILFNDFKQRLRFSKEAENGRFQAALSVHSPYSTHPILAKNALDIARRDDLLVSTHFMESQAEREWIDGGKGDFENFFKAFSPYARPLTTSLEYLKLFQGCKTLFTHCVQVTDEELEMIESQKGTITHCPRSNRLLGTGALHVKKVLQKDINFTLGTDGLSSNTTLNLWDELRGAIFTHQNQNLPNFAKLLLTSVTRNGAKALGQNSGELTKGKEADIITVSLEQEVHTIEQVALQALLHVKSVSNIFIQGEKVAIH